MSSEIGPGHCLKRISSWAGLFLARAFQICLSALVLYTLYALNHFLNFSRKARANGGLAQSGSREAGGNPGGNSNPPSTFKTPLVLVHPALQNAASWFFYHSALHKSGYGPIYVFDYSCREASLMAAGQGLADFLNTVAANHPGQKLTIIGASLGGLVARSGLTCLDHPESIGALISLACPHRGSSWAGLAPGFFPLLAAVDYKSPSIRALEEREQAIPYLAALSKISFYSSRDEIVRPADSLHPPADHNWREIQTCEPISHMTIMLNKPTIHRLIQELEHLKISDCI